MSMPEYNTVEIDKAERIAWVSLNRPEKRSAMSPELHFEMVDVLTRLDLDDEVEVLVLTGEGEAFSAGMDLKLFFRDLDDNPAARAAAREADRSWGWYKLTNFSKPTIAMVNGYCFGGAFIPLVACDFAIAAEDAMFGLSEVNWGILPGRLVSKVVTMTMNYRKSMYYAATGRPFDGMTAEEIGLITYAVPAARLRAEVIELARDLMKKNPDVLRLTKETIKSVRMMSIEESYDYIQAKTEQLRYRDAQNTRARGMAELLDEKSCRPGHEAVKRPDRDA